MKPPTRKCRQMMLAALIVILNFSLPALSATNDSPSKGTKQSLKRSSNLQTSSEIPIGDEQKIAEKKQDDQGDLFNTDEFLQIKPEEIKMTEQGKDNEPMISINDLSSSSSQANPHDGTQQPLAEHKSIADDELLAHLASDSNGTQESSPPLQPSARSAQVHGSGYWPPARDLRSARSGPQSAHPPPAHGHRGPRVAGHQGPGYETFRDKLAGGLSSIVGHHHYHQHQRSPSSPARPYPGRVAPRPLSAPAPAPLSPPAIHQGLRYLPRGAAAGYAAFREFVRAQANRYKQQVTSNSGPHEPVAYNAAPNHNGGRYTDANPSPSPPYQQPTSDQRPYQSPNSSGPTVSNEPHNVGPKASAAASKTKVSVTQAFIPHLVPSGEHDASKQYSSGPAAYGSSSAGKPEHNKDFGMIIHYPQATVYTEPMSIDQVHKLTGPGIGQVLDQLQYNLSSGHRDESSMIRPDNKHHIGHGLQIQAKEYLAPGKGGRYVPITAAVISSSPSSGSNHELGEPYQTKLKPNQPAHDGRQHYELANEQYLKPESGPGYELPRESANSNQAMAQNHQSGKMVSNNADHGGASGSLEAIYGPDVGSQIQSFANSVRANTPIKYSEHDHRSPLTMMPQHGQPNHSTGYRGHRAPNEHRRPPYGPAQQHGGGANRQRHQLNGGHSDNNPHHHRQNQPPHQSSQNSYRQQSRQNQQQAYEQTLHKQMSQMLRDFQLGDDQYSSKNFPATAQSNQGYPDKLMQKYRQQQQASAQSKPNYGLEHNDAVELPQGPNDQIGEISELIDALKGTLESYKIEEPSYGGPQQSAGKLEDVRYLSSTLGQAPTFAIQVPVAEGAVHETAQKGAPGAGAEPSRQQPNGPYQLPPNANGYSQSQQTSGPQQSHDPSIQQQPQQQSYGPPPPSPPPPPPPPPPHQPHQLPQPQIPSTETYGASEPRFPSGPNYQQAPPQPGQLTPQYNQEQQQQKQPERSHANDGPHPMPEINNYQRTQASQADHHSEQQVQLDYGTQSYGQHVSPQPQLGYMAPPAPEAPRPDQQQSQPSAYTSNEHSLVIDHLIPVGQQQQLHNQAIGHQEQQQQQLVPTNQISLVAPTENQYQSAQSLSSFVDSLPADYQDFLRQPPASPVLESSHEQLLSSIGDGYSSNTTIATAADILKSVASNQVNAAMPAPEPEASQKVSGSKTSATSKSRRRA